MHPVKLKWQEFIAVTEESADVQLAIVATFVLPTFFLILGTLLLSQLDPAAPFTSAVEAVGGKIYLALVLIAGFAYWRLGVMAASIYRRDRTRLRK